MVRTSEYVQLRLLAFFRSNVKISKVVEELLRVEGIKVTRKTVSKYYKRFKQNLPLGDLPRSGRPPTLLREHYDFIDQKLEANDELTSVGK